MSSQPSTLSSPAAIASAEATDRARNAARSASSTRGRRVIGLVVAVGSAGVLGLAAWLNPAAGGLGTHQQLNLPACGWIAAMDLPCFTCGMTTSFSHAADGNLLQSFLTQPMGCLLALTTAMALLLGSYVAITGSPVARVLLRMWRPRLGFVLIGVFLAAWIFKIASYKGVI